MRLEHCLLQFAYPRPAADLCEAVYTASTILVSAEAVSRLVKPDDSCHRLYQSGVDLCILHRSAPLDKTLATRVAYVLRGHQVATELEVPPGLLECAEWAVKNAPKLKSKLAYVQNVYWIASAPVIDASGASCTAGFVQYDLLVSPRCTL